MFLVLALVTGLAYWDEERESSTALEDFAAEQSTLASSLAANVSARLATVRRDARIAADLALRNQEPPPSVAASYAFLRVRPKDAPVSPLTPSAGVMLLHIPATEDRVVDVGVAPSTLLLTVSQVEHPGDVVVLLRPPGSSSFYTTDGHKVAADTLRTMLDQNRKSARVARSEAAALGLPERTAFAGLANVDADALGRWGIAAIATAHRERDRELRAGWRLVLGVAVASGLVLAFGGIALRKQRKQLVLERDLAVAAVQNERDERLARASRAAVMGTFAMGIAHEVSTPLGVIVGRAEQLLGRITGDDRAERSARTIIEQADRIKLLVRRFLDLARGGPPEFARVDSSSVVRGAIALVAHRFEKAGVTLATDVPSQMPTIQCDRALLEHALVNLLLNACEACKPGNRVELTARSDGRLVAFVVTDDGAGITSEDAARATEPFFTTKSEGTGTGLGLAIASEIVKSHRGTLTITPRSPRGTRACVEIPIPSDEVRDAA
jgi:two-component system, NtrC family, sensor kinase